MKQEYSPASFLNTMKIEPRFLIVFGLALFVRMAFLLFFHYFSIARGFGGFYPLQSGSDDLYYFDRASRMSSLGFFEILRYPVLAPGFTKLLAFVFKIFGSSLLVGKVFNVLLGVAAVCFVYRIAKSLNPNNAFLIASLCALYPAFVFYSTQLLKDMLFCLVFLVAVYLAVLVFKAKSVAHVYSYLFLFFGCVIYLYFVRNYAAVLLAFSFFVSLLVLDIRKFLYSLPFWVVGVLVVFGMFPSLIKHVLAVVQDPGLIAEVRAVGYSHGGSAYGIRFGGDLVGNLFGYLLSFLYLLFGPMPWHVKSFTHLIALPESFLLMTFVVPAVLGFGNALINRRKENLFILLTALFYLAFVASFSDNAGANTRLRMIGVILIMLVSRFEVFRNKSEKKSTCLR
jgi:4-amino-4-deoxy-L-arabinose transferase-like glycosyltransferase